jgi:hypothetical protein
MQEGNTNLKFQKTPIEHNKEAVTSNNKAQRKGDDKHQGSKKCLNTNNNVGTSMNTNKTQQRGHQ